jgi:acyl dehydratase
VTGDYNPIHVSRLLARLFGFRRDLVHGMWGLARATAGLEELADDGPVRVDVAFKGPLYMEHEVTVRASPCAGGRSLRLFCEGDERPAMQVAVRRVAADAEVGAPPR